MWRRFVRAVRNIDLHKLILEKDDFLEERLVDANSDELVATAARCIDAFFAEVKHSKSIVNAVLYLMVGASVDDLSVFIQTTP